MPVISQDLTIPANVVTGGTIQANDISALYQAMNAFNIPGSVGVWQQGFVDDNAYTCTGGGGTRDFTITAASNKAIFFLVPFSWAAATAGIGVGLILRVDGADAAATSTTFTLSANSSGNGLIAGFIGAKSTSVDRAAFMIGIDDQGTALRAQAATVTISTSDRTSVGFKGSTGSPAATFTLRGVRIWTEG